MLSVYNQSLARSVSEAWQALVWRLTSVRGNDLLVLLCIAGAADPMGHSRITAVQIASLCNCSDKTAQASIKALIGEGLITRRGRTLVLNPESFTGFKPEEFSGLLPTSYQSVPVKVSEPVKVSGFTEPEEVSALVRKPEEVTGSKPEESSGSLSSNSSSQTTTKSVGLVTTGTSAPQENPVTGFPLWARARLTERGPVDPSVAVRWGIAWQTVAGMAKEWDPQMHLTKYLAQRKAADREPNPEEWVKWFIEDEHQSRRTLKAEQSDDTRQWWE